MDMRLTVKPEIMTYIKKYKLLTKCILFYKSGCNSLLQFLFVTFQLHRC